MHVPFLDPVNERTETNSVRSLHQIKVEIYTDDDLKIVGLPIRLPLNSFRCRLFDLLNDDRAFIPVTEVKLDKRNIELVGEITTPLNGQLITFVGLVA